MGDTIKTYIKKHDMTVWIGFIWLRIVARGELWRTQ